MQYEAQKDREPAKAKANRLQDAITLYAAGRSYGLGGTLPDFDEWWTKDSKGDVVVRWGFYPEHPVGPSTPSMRKRAPSPAEEPAAKRPCKVRKMSISQSMICLDLSSEASSEAPAEEIKSNIDDLLVEDLTHTLSSSGSDTESFT